jgi:hypothetical protein
MSPELRQECIEAIEALLEILAEEGAGVYPGQALGIKRAERLLAKLKRP